MASNEQVGEQKEQSRKALIYMGSETGFLFGEDKKLFQPLHKDCGGEVVIMETLNRRDRPASTMERGPFFVSAMCRKCDKYLIHPTAERTSGGTAGRELEKDILAMVDLEPVDLPFPGEPKE